LVSQGVSGTPFIVGGTPIIETVTQQTNNLHVTFSHPDPGNTAVTYYYSDDASGNNLIQQVYLPSFDISGTVTRTIYVVSINSAGKLVSEPVTATPFIFGTTPVIEYVTPGTNKLTVSFSQSSLGTTPVTYYYSDLSNGSNRVGPVTFPFDISTNVFRRVYIIAENSGGTLISQGDASGTPYIFGSAPSINTVNPGTNSLTVNFNPSVGGTTPINHYYSYDSSGVPRVGQIQSGASTFTISDISSAKTVYIVAGNPAGNLVSAGISGTPYIFGDPLLYPL
jgi:hypothetical protein